MPNLEYIENLSYSAEVQEAVRYGFQYRKTSEELAKSDNYRLNFCLPNPSDILLFLAEAIIGGVTYDVIKSVALKTWKKLKDRISKNETETSNILTNEDALVEFYTYIKEFHEKQMNITEQQEKYIKEEVIADYCSEQTSIIFEKHNRLASVKEHIAIHKDAYRKAEYIIIRKKID